MRYGRCPARRRRRRGSAPRACRLTARAIPGAVLIAHAESRRVERQDDVAAVTEPDQVLELVVREARAHALERVARYLELTGQVGEQPARPALPDTDVASEIERDVAIE